MEQDLKAIITDEDIKRFKANIKKVGDCHIWQGKVTDYGIGRFYVYKQDPGKKTRIKQLNVQRLSWWLEYGTLDDKLFIKNTCKHKRCVNPEHLILVTASECDALKKQGAISKI